MVEFFALLLAVLIALATCVLVYLAVKQARRTTRVEAHVGEIHGIVQALDTRLQSVSIQCHSRAEHANHRLGILENPQGGNHG